jgi:hypothetical protein
MTGGKIARELSCLKRDRIRITDSRLSKKESISGILPHSRNLARKRLEYGSRGCIRYQQPQKSSRPLAEVGEECAFALPAHHKSKVLKLKDRPLYGLAADPELPYKLRLAWQRASGILAGADVVLKRFRDYLVFSFIGHDVHGM